MLAADVFAALAQSFHIGHHDVGFVLLTFIRVCVDVIFPSPYVFLASYACPVQSPCWYLQLFNVLFRWSSCFFSSC